MRMTTRTASGIAIAVVVVNSVLAADPQTIDWSKAPAKSVTLFYPGQSTSDWLQSPEHKGARQVTQGRGCLSCHDGDEKDLGNKLVKGGGIEPTPIPGKNGVIDVAVQAAHDAEYVYFRFQWRT